MNREIDFGKMQGLAPAIVQDAASGEVLMLATLSDEDWVSVNTVIEESTAWQVIPRLKEANGQGIVEYPLNKVVL